MRSLADDQSVASPIGDVTSRNLTVAKKDAIARNSWLTGPKDAGIVCTSNLTDCHQWFAERISLENDKDILKVVRRTHE